MEHDLINKSILDQLEEIEKLPVLPSIIPRFNRMIGDPNCRMGDLVNIVCSDPIIYTSLLKICNSSHYTLGTSGAIDSVEIAIVRLGLATTRSIVCSASMLRAFSAMQQGGLDYSDFWMHSLSTGTVAQIVYDHCSPNFPKPIDITEIYLAGLVHDVGKIILNEYFNKAYREVLDMTKLHATTTLSMEQKILGTDHTEVSSWLVGKWTNDIALQDAVRWHHDPFKAHYDNQGVAAVIHTADYICNRRDLGNSGNAVIPTLKNEIWNFLKIDEEIMNSINSEIDSHGIRESSAAALKARSGNRNLN